MKKFFALIFIFILSSQAYALELPEKIYEWYLTGGYVQPLNLEVTSEDLGRVIYKTYKRDAPKGTLEIILTEGTGTGSLYVPDEVKKSKGLMPASEYKIFEVNGKKAILENQSYLPLALAVCVNDDVVLTIESASLNQDELIKIAEEILSSWNFIKDQEQGSNS
ncbi:MAG: DUF4367 domain-containing protein [Synergistaceae bacterium]|nr:DUF4367 domain-containing protein [Synergistaceae bacterium]